MDKLAKVCQGGKNSIENYYLNCLEELNELYNKYSHINFGEYEVALSTHDTACVKVEEKEFENAIRFFRKQFSKAGETEVRCIGKYRFLISYNLAKDFNVYCFTEKPAKYLKQGCVVQERQITTYEIACHF